MDKYWNGKKGILLSGMILTTIGYASTNTVELNRISNEFKNIETL